MNDDHDTLREEIRDRYRAAALAVDEGCCGTTACTPEEADRFGAGLYGDDAYAELPEAALVASLGSGNPMAVQLHAVRERASTEQDLRPFKGRATGGTLRA